MRYIMLLMDTKEGCNPVADEIECSELLSIGTNVIVETIKVEYYGVIGSHLFTYYAYEGGEPESTIIMQCYEHQEK